MDCQFQVGWRIDGIVVLEDEFERWEMVVGKWSVWENPGKRGSKTKPLPEICYMMMEVI